MGVVTGGEEPVVDGEAEVVVVQLDQRRPQLRRVTQGRGKGVGLELEPSRERRHGKVEDGVVGGRDEPDDHEPDEHRTRVWEAERRVERLQVVEISEIANLN